jgi:hypothetical protein
MLAAPLMLGGCCPYLCFVVHGDAYKTLAHPKPYIEKWEKATASKDDVLQASEECGGGRHISSPNFGQIEIQAMRQPGETEREARSRRFYIFERCMLAKGFHFTGECYDNEIARNSPACGAP